MFNLAPGLPLDGGRLLEAAVWTVTGNRSTGTVAAGWCGRVVAVLLLVWMLGRPLVRGEQPDLINLVWSAMIAALLWQGATSAIGVARLRRSAAAVRLADLVQPALALPADDVDWMATTGPDPRHLVAVKRARPAGPASAEARRALAAGGDQPTAGTPCSGPDRPCPTRSASVSASPDRHRAAHDARHPAGAPVPGAWTSRAAWSAWCRASDLAEALTVARLDSGAMTSPQEPGASRRRDRSRPAPRDAAAASRRATACS